MKLDKIDLKILQLLTKNGRMSYVDIAKELNLSRVAVRERVQSLQKEGIIEQFTVVINSEKFGKKVSVFFELECEPSQMIQVANQLCENEKVISCYQMTGPGILHMYALVNDLNDLERFINEELSSIKGITHINSHILLRRFKSQKGLKI